MHVLNSNVWMLHIILAYFCGVIIHGRFENARISNEKFLNVGSVCVFWLYRILWRKLQQWNNCLVGFLFLLSFESGERIVLFACVIIKIDCLKAVSKFLLWNFNLCAVTYWSQTYSGRVINTLLQNNIKYQFNKKNDLIYNCLIMKVYILFSVLWNNSENN